ncbi:hypothetical protein KJ068_00865 [bacterium]|nr:hypothetical protein [bacterium]
MIITEMNPKDTSTARKIYQSPCLVTYGAIRHITHAIGNMQNLDGGAVMGMRRSSLVAPS